MEPWTLRCLLERIRQFSRKKLGTSYCLIFFFFRDYVFYLRFKNEEVVGLFGALGVEKKIFAGRRSRYRNARGFVARAEAEDPKSRMEHCGCG